MMDVSVSRVLFGELSEHQIRVACKSNNCAGATVGVKVVGYCRVGEQAAAASDCSMSVSPPELNIPRVKAWLVEARLETQADSDFEDVDAELAGTSGRPHYNPVLFAGPISQLGPVPHVFVCKEAVNQTVEFSVSELLVGKTTDSVVETSCVNCSNQSLPSPPFTLHAKVIVYCSETAQKRNRCLVPVPSTAERLRKLRLWIAEQESH